MRNAAEVLYLVLYIEYNGILGNQSQNRDPAEHSHSLVRQESNEPLFVLDGMDYIFQITFS